MSFPRTPRRLRALALMAVLLSTACATSGGTTPAADGTAEGTALSGEVVVQAAASLTDAFTEIADAFGEIHPDVTVTANFAGSQSLATQIVQGAPADVFASADDAQMQVVADEGLLAGSPEAFAANGLAIAVEAGNPLGIDGLPDLADPAVVLVLADPEVPAGALAARALDRAGVAVSPASLELDVRSVLAKVELGEADAGIVYASDLVTAGDGVEQVVIPEAADEVTTYPIAVLADAPNPAAAAAFVAFVRSGAGQAILASYGFSRA